MVGRKEFCEKYVPMAREGKSALEIGRAVGFEGDDKQVALKVSQRSTLYRKQLKEQALKQAEQNELDEDATQELVDEVASLMPKLKTRTRESNDLADFLRGLMENADTPQK